MPGIPGRREPHEDAQFPSQLVGERASELRRLLKLSQEDIAERMVRLEHSKWARQTVGQMETATRNVTVDELVSLAAALQTTVAFLLSPNPIFGLERDYWVDIGAPASLGRRHLPGLYGFSPPKTPEAGARFDWPDLNEIWGPWTEEKGSGE